jgi:hypothetical protein
MCSKKHFYNKIPYYKDKGKVLVLYFNLSPRREGVLRVWRHSLTHSLTSELDGGEWSGSRPGLFTPRERTPGIHWIGGWVGPRAGLDVIVKRKICSPCRDSNPPNIQPVAQRYNTELYRLLNNTIWCESKINFKFLQDHSFMKILIRLYDQEMN